MHCFQCSFNFAFKFNVRRYVEDGLSKSGASTHYLPAGVKVRRMSDLESDQHRNT